MKTAIKIVGGLIALIIVIFIGFLVTFDVNQYKGQIVKIVEEQTGRSFTIEGELGLGISLIPTVAVNGVKFGNSNWGNQPEMLTVGTFEAQVALLPLLSKNIEVKRLILNDATILLEKNKEGKGNWELAVAEAKPAEKKDAAAAPAVAPKLDINEVRINNASLSYTDASTGTTEKVTINVLSVESSGFFKPMDLFVDASYNDIPLKLSGTSGSLSALTENKNFPLDIEAEVGDISAAVKGAVDKPADLQGLDLNVEVNIAGVKTINQLARQELPDIGAVRLVAVIAQQKEGIKIEKIDLSAGELKLAVSGTVSDLKNMKGLNMAVNLSVPKLSDLNKLAKSELPELGPLSLSATASDQEGGYQVKDMKLNLANTDLAGDASIKLSGKRPALDATLTSNLIDLAELMPAQEEQPKQKEKKEKVFSADPLPFESLKAADARLALNAKKIKTADMDLDDVKLALNLNNGKLSINPLSANTGGGKATIKVDLDTSSGKSASLDTSIVVKDFQASSLPHLAGKLTGGKTNIDINIAGKGSSVADIMAVSNGKVVMQMGEATLKGSDEKGKSTGLILMTFNNVFSGSVGTKKDTLISCGVVNARIKDGMATLDKGLAFNTNYMNIIGSGQVNLKTEELKIGIDPQARKGSGISVGQLAELVTIKGTLANPTAGPDTKAALRTAASAGAALATGGLSVLAQGLLDRGTSDADPCSTAMGVKTAKKSEPKSGAKKQKEKKSVTEKATKSIKDTFKGLFD